jgi:hypothetical protein
MFNLKKINFMYRKNFNLRNVATVFACLAVTVMLSACGGGANGNSIKIEVADGASYNIDVKIVDLKSGETTLASAEWNSGSFTLNLTQELPQDIRWDSESYLSFLTGLEDPVLSNENIKLIAPGLELTNEYGNRVGWLTYEGKADKTEIHMVLLFLDGDCTVSGQTRDKKSITLNLKKGWNRLYYSSTSQGYGKGKITSTSTQKPDMEMAWVPFL